MIRSAKIPDDAHVVLDQHDGLALALVQGADQPGHAVGLLGLLMPVVGPSSSSRRGGSG